jgi:hypothetical protein
MRDVLHQHLIALRDLRNKISDEAQTFDLGPSRQKLYQLVDRIDDVLKESTRGA